MRWLNDFKQAYPPIESVMNMAPRKKIPAPLLIYKLLNNAQETTGRAVTLTSVDPVSEKGGSISRTDTYVIYMPPVDYLGEDSFKYTITVDGGRTAEILVKINVTEQTFIQPLSKTPLDNGKVLVKFITLPYPPLSTTDRFRLFLLYTCDLLALDHIHLLVFLCSLGSIELE